MMLLRDEYERDKRAFLDRYREDIEAMLKREYKDFMEYELRYTTIVDFAKDYSGAAILVMFALYFAWAKDVITFDIFATIGVMILFIHACIFGAWKRDKEYSAKHTFIYRKHSLIADYVYKKMIEDVGKSVIGDDFERNVQFYSIALYEIPREFSFDFWK